MLPPSRGACVCIPVSAQGFHRDALGLSAIFQQGNALGLSAIFQQGAEGPLMRPLPTKLRITGQENVPAGSTWMPSCIAGMPNSFRIALGLIAFLTSHF